MFSKNLLCILDQKVGAWKQVENNTDDEGETREEIARSWSRGLQAADCSAAKASLH